MLWHLIGSYQTAFQSYGGDLCGLCVVFCLFMLPVDLKPTRGDTSPDHRQKELHSSRSRYDSSVLQRTECHTSEQ